MFIWFMTEQNLIDANKARKDRNFEDDIFGFVSYKTDKASYLIDIHYEHYKGGINGFDLEMYFNECGCHGEWVGYIKEILSATDFNRFKNRVEKLVVRSINDFEKEWFTNKCN